MSRPRPTQPPWYLFRTADGEEFMLRPRGGRYEIIHRGVILGRAMRAGAAAEKLANGKTKLPVNGVEPETLGIPTDLSAWEHLMYTTS